MTNVQIQSQQEFTYEGRVGAFLFICGPIASGLGYAWLMNELSNGYPQISGPLLVQAAGALAFLLGCVMMLVGRTYQHDVTVQSGESQKTRLGER
ncbi:hypothetical protein AB4Z43_29010 [Mesorhizobium sp. 2RAF45]|uniref:hypothetical protein n=1 Tax=Mesorhizobium sp. 2RAF45 TaxID=3233001 RepID=UPI003F958D72